LPVFLGVMTDAIEFLRESAEKLRKLAACAPDISDHLRRMAEELETTAAELESRRDGAR
jgi:hypothetical protein